MTGISNVHRSKTLHRLYLDSRVVIEGNHCRLVTIEDLNAGKSIFASIGSYHPGDTAMLAGYDTVFEVLDRGSK